MRLRPVLAAHLLLLVPIVLHYSATECRGSLDSSVNKYKNSCVQRQDIEKLRQFDHLIQYFSGICYFRPRHKVSPDFVRALILAESGANPLAVSGKNALGLGQILFETGDRAAKELACSLNSFHYVAKHKLDKLQQDDLFDPAINILLTCYLVAKYNYKFDGRLDLVVSAWNAGEYTESLSRFSHAPYQETEDLIGKVNAYYVYLLRNRVFR